MRSNVRVHHLFFVLVLLVFSGCAITGPSWNSEGYATIQGTIRDGSGKSIEAPVTVSLGRSSVTPTDGAYAIGWVAPGKYILRASSPGYEEYQQIVSVPSGGELTHNITLSPAGMPAGSSGTPPANSGTPANNSGTPATPRPGSSLLPLAGKTIVVDPGHGGFNPSLGDFGTSGEHGIEKHNVLAIALTLRDLLESSGAHVIMTREKDINPSVGTRFETDPYGQLKARVDLANRSGADVYVSIHNDWHSNTEAAGVKTFYYSEVGRKLAKQVQEAVVHSLGATDRQTEWGRFRVIRETTMPSILIELGFLSNPQEDYLLSTPEYRTRAAQGLHDGLVQYFETRVS